MTARPTTDPADQHDSAPAGDEDRLSLFPLTFDEALGALLGVDPRPAATKTDATTPPDKGDRDGA